MIKRDPRSLGEDTALPPARAPPPVFTDGPRPDCACPAGPCRHFSLRFLSVVAARGVDRATQAGDAVRGRQLSRLERQSTPSVAGRLISGRPRRAHPPEPANC